MTNSGMTETELFLVMACRRADIADEQAAALQERVRVLEAKNKRLREALANMVYETTSLSPMETNGDHKCIIKADALQTARAALAREPTDG